MPKKTKKILEKIREPQRKCCTFAMQLKTYFEAVEVPFPGPGDATFKAER
jgi:hypothetical protein